MNHAARPSWRHVRLVSLLLVAGCSGTGPPVQQPEAEAPEPVAETTAMTALIAGSDALRWVDPSVAVPRVLIEGRPVAAYYDVSPDRQHVAVTFTGGRGTTLTIADPSTGQRRDVYQGERGVVFTTAWSPDGDRLAFGFYLPEERHGEKVMGDGGIRIVGADGNGLQDVGCSISKVAMSWTPQGKLVVADEKNLYVVEPNGCATIATTDRRKMHHVTFSPTGQNVAYIFRDLGYNRARRAYEPDSSLYVARYDGRNATLVLGDKYRARHLAWSPDGASLAFDVASQDDAALRSVAIYDLETGKASFLTDPESTSRNVDVRPRWSPDGQRVAFERRRPGERGAMLALHAFLFTTLTAQLSPAARWGWAGDDALYVSDGPRTALLDVKGDTLATAPAGDVIFMQRR